MTHTTQRFGEIEYSEESVFTFEDGLLGLPELKRFLIRAGRRTEPIRWLVSVDEAKEFPIVRPEAVFPDYPPEKALEEACAALGRGRIAIYNLLVLPKDLSKSTVNLRAPLFVNLTAKKGAQLQCASLNHQPVAMRVFRELFAAL